MGKLYTNQWREYEPEVDAGFVPSKQTKEEIKMLTKQYFTLWQADKHAMGRTDEITIDSERKYKTLDKVCEMLGISYEASAPGLSIIKKY